MAPLCLPNGPPCPKTALDIQVCTIQTILYIIYYIHCYYYENDDGDNDYTLSAIYKIFQESIQSQNKKVDYGIC